MFRLKKIFRKTRNFIGAVKFILDNGQDIILYDRPTGLYSRNFFEEIAIKTLKTAVRNRFPIAFIMADMDGLKKINDKRGHLEGDRLLHVSAGIFKECARDTDIIARYGGDEFILLLPGTDRKGALVLIKKLKNNLNKKGIEWSFGAAVANPALFGSPRLAGKSRSDLNNFWKLAIRQLIQKADGLLYLNKKSKKNAR